MFNWDEWENRKNRAVLAAQASSKGMGREHLVPGAIITLSPNLCTGDRSFSHEVYEVIARNPGHVLIRQKTEARSDFDRRSHFINIHEHEFYPAEHLIDALEKSKTA